MKWFLSFFALLVLADGPKGTRKLPTLEQLKTVHRTQEIDGHQLKNLTRPKEAKRLEWEKVVVGQKTLDVGTLAGVPERSEWRRLGFEAGDVVLRISDQEVRSRDEMNRIIRDANDNSLQKIQFKVLRNNQIMLLEYQLRW